MENGSGIENVRPVFVKSSLLSHLGEPPESVFLKLLFCKLQIDLCIVCSPISASPSGHFYPFLPLFLSDPTAERKTSTSTENTSAQERQIYVKQITRVQIGKSRCVSWLNWI